MLYADEFRCLWSLPKQLIPLNFRFCLTFNDFRRVHFLIDPESNGTCHYAVVVLSRYITILSVRVLHIVGILVESLWFRSM